MSFWHHFTALVCAALLILAVTPEYGSAARLPLRGAARPCSESGPSFWSLGVAVMTDKVSQDPALMFWGTSHSYQAAYEKYLRKLRCVEGASLMEIGLGCGMSYPEGHSIPLWLALLPRATINVFEYDEKCARAFFKNPAKVAKDGVPWPSVFDSEFARRARLETGDQSNEADLARAMAVFGPQDVIVDDGGHTIVQQITSLRVLFRFVKPGGVYILEDLVAHGGGEEDTLDYIFALQRALVAGGAGAPPLDAARYPGAAALLPLLESVDCFIELCVFTRRAAGASELPAPGDLGVSYQLAAASGRGQAER
jgi:hypothetical protein